ncbi:MAG: hypothetical protein IKD07_03000 [Clostridia bacterium]|nr:hypothetical protein [Clostridia bacterium]
MNAVALRASSGNGIIFHTIGNCANWLPPSCQAKNQWDCDTAAAVSGDSPLFYQRSSFVFLRNCNDKFLFENGIFSKILSKRGTVSFFFI